MQALWRSSAIAVGFLISALTNASAEDAELRFSFDIPQLPAEQSVKKLAVLVDAPLIFRAENVEKIEANVVEGEFSVLEALDQMLSGTPLHGSLTEDGVIIVTLPQAQNVEGNKLSRKSILAQLASGVSSLVVGMGMSGAAAQEEAGADANDTILVTGTRLANKNLTSSSSVTVLGAEEIDVRGVLRVEDLLNTLPQTLSGQSSTTGVNGAQATVNLRGLGSNRTLVLVDGKRLPYGSPINAAADLNQIPSQLVKRVEVLTGGATAIYGSDAVSGVVNFIMDRDFQGLEADFQGSFFQAGNNNSNIERVLNDFNQPDPDGIIDGRSLDFSMVAGTNIDGGRGNITAYFGYSKDNAVRWEDRDFTACPFGTRDGGADFSCNGSGSQPRLTRYSRTGAGGFNLVVDETTGMLRNYSGATDSFNFALGNYLQRPRERFTYGAFTRYDIKDNVEFFLDFSVADNTTDAQIAPSGLALGRTSTVNCDNPLLNAEMLATFCDAADVTIGADGVPRAPLRIGRRNLEFPRVAQFSLNTKRFVGGFRGEAFEGFDYEVFGQFSKVDFSELLINDVSTSRVTRAIDVVTDPVTMQPVCRSVITGEDPDCVPFDVFSPGGITEAGSNYVTTPSLRLGDTSQLVFGGSLSGDLTGYGISSPFAETGVLAAVGFEYRRDSLSLRPDSSDTRTNARVPVDGKVAVYEFFVEMQAPLVQNAAFAEEISLTGAYRFSDYFDTTGTQNTYSIGLSWVPVSDLRFRGQYQRATRSPNPIELFNPQEFGLDTLSTQPNGLNDPCAGDFDAGTTTPEPFRSFEDCARTGVTMAQYGTILDSAGNIDTLVGGNPALEPELSDTWTAGVILQPRVIPGLVVSLDYFSINVEGFVGTVDPNDALNQCLDTGAANFCSLINRDSAGTLFLVDGESFIQGTLINTGRIETSGFDIGASYSFGLDEVGLGGDLQLNYIGTVLSELKEQSLPGEQAIECAGFHGSACDNPAPKYRHRINLGWSSGPFAANLAWRYISSVDQFSTAPTEVNFLEATSFFDLSMQYDVTEEVRLRAGVNNVLDQDPPLTSLAGFGGGEDAGRGNTYPQIYDAQGRYIFAGATVRF